MKKVLVVATTSLCTDGITAVLLRIAQIVSEEHQVAFALGEGCTPEVRGKLGQIGVVYNLPNREEHLGGYLCALWKLIKKKRFSIVHIHGNDGTMAFELAAAYWGGARIRITHCHATMTNLSWKRQILKYWLNRLATHPVACGQLVGEGLYTKPFRVLTNGIDCEKFAFDSVVREQLRKDLDLDGCFVIGHIGRFNEQKNHKKLLHIFAEAHRREPRARLVLFGEGELYPECKKLSVSLGIDPYVLFCGRTSSPSVCLNAMDVFVLPSLFEGLPIVGIEAQANGLPCVFSDTITKEADILPDCRFISLDETDAIWAEQILSTRCVDRPSGKNLVSEADYTDDILCKQVKELYG